MGLDTSHDCWQGAYSAFMRWRRMVAKAAGLPPLDLMEGFYKSSGSPLQNPFWKQYNDDESRGVIGDESIWNNLPIKWDCLPQSALYTLLHHSDCEGEIDWKDCKGIANALSKLLPKMPKGDAGGHIGDWQAKTNQFIKGLKLAHKRKENVKFY